MTNVINLAIAKQNLAASGSVLDEANSAFREWLEQTMRDHDETVEAAINWRKRVYGDVA